MDLKNGYGFIIVTDSYAGNFEREMCAYLTGQIGECGVGSEFVSLLEDSRPEFDNMIQVADEYGCYRPVEIYAGKNEKYNSLIIYFEEMPSADQIQFMKENAKNFSDARSETSSFYDKEKDKIEILDFKMLQVETTATEIKEVNF